MLVMRTDRLRPLDAAEQIELISYQPGKACFLILFR